MKTLNFLGVAALLFLIVLAFHVKKSNDQAVADSKPADHYRVVKVADGDTLTGISESGQKVKVRFCGIDAPEKDQPLGMQSKQTLEKLVLDKEVSIMKIEKDRYGRLVGEVFIPQNPEGGKEDIFVNGEMLKSGMAYHYAQYSGNCPNRDILVQLEAQAQKNRAGVWGGNYQKPWEHRRAKR